MSGLTKKLYPLLYSIRSSHHLIKEILLLPWSIKTQKRDWAILTRKYPDLSQFDEQKKEIRKQLMGAHKNYIEDYSASLISLSLQRGAFFYFFCEVTKPQVILDLGSGFSSYVFRLFAEKVGALDIISVDESEYWLNETEEFLLKYKLPVFNLLTWEEFENEQLPDFDLAFVDIGDLAFRLKILPSLMIKIKQFGGVIIVDDFHVPFYRNAIRRMCEKMNLRIYSLRSVTRTRLNHNALISTT